MMFTPIALLVLAISMAGSGMFGQLPTTEHLENPNSNLASEVYSADKKILGKYYYQNRSNVKYKDLSPNLVNALLATEDIRFYRHSGVDIKGLFRVLIRTVILRQGSGGGSTITQQLAKNLFHDKPRSSIGRVKQKFMEWIISTKLEKSYTKEEIIAMYLNTVAFGNNAYGIKSASAIFFDTNPEDIKVQEAAVLVGLLKAPTYYSPKRNPNNSLQRRNVVLAQMKKYDFISPEVCDSLQALPIELSFKEETHNEGLATYFREELRVELNTWCKENRKSNGEPYNLYRDGLKIYTTIDSRMQRYAEQAVAEHLKSLQKTFFKHWEGRVPWKDTPQIIEYGIKRTDRYKSLRKSGMSRDSIDIIFDTPVKMKIFSWEGERDTVLSPLDSIKYYKKFLQTGFMAIEPQTGYIKAWVGGNDYRYFKYDHVKRGKRQVGSTFKPFLYSLAMQEGYSPCFKVPNIPVTFQKGEYGLLKEWTPKNSDNKYGGELTLKGGLANSVNSLSAFLMKRLGPNAVVDLAKKMGIESDLDAVPSLCLGVSDLSVYELVGAYATFADKGIWTEPVFLTRIEDKNGIVLYEKIPKKREAMSEETAYLMLQLLRGVVDNGTGKRVRFRYKIENEVAGKTGTTQNNSDGWFMGITPELVAGTWVGCQDRSVHFRTTDLGQGANMALPIWGLFMQKVYADESIGLSKGGFEAPPNGIRVELDCSKYEVPIKSDKGEGSGNGFGF
ncbi:MAG: PBP1A family penicillin-binding protein [Bacteroidia bacterium]|nr:PBP1A family penicillin-binding protein [Bacteroidia bacterium]